MPGSEDYAIGRRLMVGEVNAAIDGAFAGGATEVVVNDSHSRMSNLIPDDLDPRARLVSGHFKPMYMMQGLDSSFEAIFFVGYHGAIGEPEAILAHTYSPRAVWEAKVDGRPVGEIGINALVASYYGVPILLVTGDQATAREARDTIPKVTVVEVKRSFGRYSAESLSPETARLRIEEAGKACLIGARSSDVRSKPCVVDVTFLIPDMAELATWIPGVMRTGPRSVKFEAADGKAAYRTFYTLLILARAVVE